MARLLRFLFLIGVALGMAEQIARFKPGENITVYAKKTLRAGRFVTIKGRTASGVPEVEEAAAKAKSLEVLGVTQRSAEETSPAASVDRLVEIVGEGAVARVLASAEIKPGESAQATAEGQVGPGVEAPLGICLNTAKAGEYAEVLLRFT
jgi:hypothetical protein